MAQAYKFDDSDSADDLGIINVPRPRAHREPCLPSDHHGPLVPPPPTAAAGVKRMKSSTASRGFRRKPEPLASLPPVPPVPVLATTTGAIPGTPKMPDTPARSRSRRKTLLERIDGWWDLGLLDKRQTLSRSQSKGVTEQKL
ncbi:hypothetical protein A9K55_007481 [Cordyceps militaris]|uniref:Uncharacterized protein n=1 Tax=Cordyceps militaris TaxID=73501 RepID=A0A2H4SK34_CORMI|nr:hypothetical protein A9K55_007481 [Cordyceps militaris]